MRIAVTGASGFIGSRLTSILAGAGADVIALSRNRPPLDVPWRQIQDICDQDARSAASDAAVIVHLAALSDASLSIREPELYARVNAQGTVNMLEAARASGAFFVLASSQRVYRPQAHPLGEGALKRPEDPYGYSKLAAELWMRMYGAVYGVSGVTLRFFSVYGPGQGMPGGTSGVVSIFLRRALAGESLWVDGDGQRDLTYVDDVAQGILVAIENRERCKGKTYNVATGVGTPLADLAKAVLAVTGSRSEIVRTESAVGGQHLVADIARARKELGYEPRTELGQGLRLTTDWLASAQPRTAEG
jgi:UDP-glucose 4-epimerase